jgi:hypothetical protein
MQYYIVIEGTEDRFGPYSVFKARKRLKQEGYVQESETRWKLDDHVALIRPEKELRRRK